MKRIIAPLISLLILALIVKSCIEPFDTGSISFEDILIVEGKLTDEFKKHEILLSRTIQLDSTYINPEKNALVYITDTEEQKIQFTEIENGKYQSNNAFIPENDKTYTLKIETSNGKKYSSSSQKLTSTSKIDAINTAIETSNTGIEAVNIKINSSSSNNTNGTYYYYEYQEAFKIIAPYWVGDEFDMTDYPEDIRLLPKEKPERRICFKTQNATGSRIQTETTSLSDDNVTDFTVRTINTNDYILSHRYTIQIKQFTQTYEAYLYHETLNSFSNSENVFSESQVGFVKGNIFNEDDIDENVIGFFEINSVAISERLFFDREDFFDTEDEVRPYPNECDVYAPLIVDENGNYPLLSAYNAGALFYDFNFDGTPALPGLYLIVPAICGDCTVLGTTEKPSFWID